MRGLGWAALAAILIAGSAAAQTDLFCRPYNDRYDKVAGGSDVRALESAEKAVPTGCPLHAQLVRRLAVARAETKPPKPADAGDELDGREPPPPAASPIDPCTQAGVDALDLTVPDASADLPPAKRDELARRYIARADTLRKCGDAPDAAKYLAAAVEADPQNYTAAAELGGVDLARGDPQGAIDADTQAIERRSHAPLDVDVLGVYADRASAYESLRMWAQAAADLRTVVDNFSVTNDSLPAPFDSYKERLAKAYLREGDEADAEATYAHTDPSCPCLDWEDKLVLGEMNAKAGQWDEAVTILRQALDAVPADAAHAPERAKIEVALGKALQGRGRPDDLPAAWESYRAAASDDPDNKDARAALEALGSPPPRPTFDEPTPPPVPLPSGVTETTDLAAYRPDPFCSQSQENDYLDGVKAASAAVNADMQALGAYSDRLQQDRARYAASPLLSYAEKIEDLNLFDEEWKRVDAQSTRLRKLGDSLIDFFNRVRADPSLVTYCK